MSSIKNQKRQSETIRVYLVAEENEIIVQNKDDAECEYIYIPKCDMEGEFHDLMDALIEGNAIYGDNSKMSLDSVLVKGLEEEYKRNEENTVLTIGWVRKNIDANAYIVRYKTVLSYTPDLIFFTLDEAKDYYDKHMHELNENYWVYGHDLVKGSPMYELMKSVEDVPINTFNYDGIVTGVKNEEELEY